MGAWWCMVDHGGCMVVHGGCMVVHGGAWWRMHLEPNALCLSVMFSLVCESKAGFSTRQLTKTWHVSGRVRVRVRVRAGERASMSGKCVRLTKP